VRLLWSRIRHDAFNNGFAIQGCTTLKNLLAACAIVLGLITVWGFIFLPKVRISLIEDKSKRVTVMVTPPLDNQAEARWVRVIICSAEVREDAGVHCIAEGWYATSLKEIGVCQPQCPFPFGRYVPRGTVQISAIVQDAAFQTLATGQKVVMR
jgi:hypothetical protein